MTVTWREILFFLILFGANLIQAITGFAGTLLAMPPSMQLLEVDEIRLFDIDRERQDKLGVLVKWILEEDLKSGIKLTVTYDEKEAYTDADFIFAQMRVGKYAMREQDEKIPLKHGCVGQETCGCGGMAYGMRTIFPMIKVIDDVEKYAKPTYWILNYSNPASIVSEACRKLRPNARIINICDMPIAIIDVVAAALEVNKKDLVYDYYGLNHFGWFTSIEYKGEDVMPKLRDYIMDQEILLPAAYLKDKGALTSSGSGGNRHTKGSWYYVWKGVYEIMKNFPETLPNTYLNYYLQQKEFVEHSDPNHTRANEVMETREKIFSTALTVIWLQERLTRASSMREATATGLLIWPSL